MSSQTWVDEFYPKDADKVPKEQALQHSLTKWKGLRREALAKHEIMFPPISIDAGSCALCVHHCSYEEDEGHPCKTCPLYLTRGDACDCCLADEDTAPYQMYSVNRDPEPMIALLEEALGEPK